MCRRTSSDRSSESYRVVVREDGCEHVDEVAILQRLRHCPVADVFTAFGTPNARHRVIERLNATAEEPTAEIELVELDGEE